LENFEPKCGKISELFLRHLLFVQSRAKKNRAAKILQGCSAYNPLYFLYKARRSEMFLRFEIFSKYFLATKKAVPEGTA